VFDLVLHLGAHKTATSFVQKTMQKNKKLLTEAGILVPALEGFRRDVSACFGLGKSEIAAKDITSVLQPQYSDIDLAHVKTVVLSDENLIGYPELVLTHGLFYPELVQRCGLLHSWLNRGPNKIVFSIRPYVSYFPSVYARWLGSENHVFSRDDITNKVNNLARGWPDVVGELLKMFPQCELVVTEYQPPGGFVDTQLEILLGPTAHRLDYNTKHFWNRGLSLARIQKIETLINNGTADPAAIEEIRKQKLRGRPERYDAFWEPDVREMLEQRYNQHKQDVRELLLTAKIKPRL